MELVQSCNNKRRKAIVHLLKRQIAAKEKQIKLTDNLFRNPCLDNIALAKKTLKSECSIKQYLKHSLMLHNRLLKSFNFGEK